MKLKLRLPAGPHELFSHEAADNMPGQTFEASSHGIIKAGRVIDAEVVEYGRAVLLTVEWPNPLVVDFLE